MLRKLHYRLMVRKYVRGITPQKKAQVTRTCTRKDWIIVGSFL